jgi:hypothetical protein
VVERTSHLTYIVRKKGGRKRGAHVNRLKFFDPLNSIEDPNVHIGLDDDEPDQSSIKMTTENDKENENTLEKVNEPEIQDPPTQKQQLSKELPNTRITRTKTNSLPKSISRYSASSAEIKNHWKHIPWISNELNIILQNEESTVGQNFPG